LAVILILMVLTQGFLFLVCYISVFTKLWDAESECYQNGFLMGFELLSFCELLSLELIHDIIW
jgi:hypothetical protein